MAEPGRQPQNNMLKAPTLLLLAASLGIAWTAQHPIPNNQRPTPNPQRPTPVGLDAYRMWRMWPYQRIGVRAYMRSTYDRSGGNEGADASHFLYQLADDKNVSLDVEGPGVLYFVRTNHWHGSPWHYEVDGKDNLVQETSTADPDHPSENSTFLPNDLFPNPLAWTWSDTRGADLSWVPIPFERSFRMMYSRTHYGTGYYIYHQFAPRTPLSQPLKSWDGRRPPDTDVLDLIRRAGADPWLESRKQSSTRMMGQVVHGTVNLAAGSAITLAHLDRAPSMITALELSAPRKDAVALGRGRLRITWDGAAHPSVDAPIALFFGAGTLYNRDNREYLVKAFPVNIRFAEDRVNLACYFPMPFFGSARIELVGPDGATVPNVRWLVRYAPFTGRRSDVGNFHATYRDIAKPERGRDMVLLDTQAMEGSPEWSGSFVGMSWIFSHNANLGTLEGDPRFFFDDSRTPQAQGTGTEEWGGGGDYWGGRNMTLPFAGHPCGAPGPREARSDEDKIESAYRILLADLFPFGRNARICLEHGGTNESTEHYESVVYWYGSPSPTLAKTDSLQIGDPASERGHGYHSPQAGAAYEITSRYELGVDYLGSQEIYPAETDKGRVTTGASEFTVRLRPENVGVLLRRKLDYEFPNQRAEVYVAPGSSSFSSSSSYSNNRLSITRTRTNWRKAGVWYTAGSNSGVYSNPPQELGATQHIVQTSNRRFRDDEFLISRELTRGRSAIRVRIKFTPVRRPLFPGHPIHELAWSEIRYDAYCYVSPAAR